MKVKLIAITLAAMMAIAGVWYFALWSPQGKNLDKAKEERAAAQVRAAELQARLTRLERLEANKEVLERDRALFSTLVPDADQLDDFILSVNERAARAGVAFVSVSPSQPRDPAAGQAVAGPTPIELQMQITGDYFAIMRFLELLTPRELTEEARLVTIDNLALAQSGDGGQLSASIGARMFIRSAVPAAAAAAPAAPQGA